MAVIRTNAAAAMLGVSPNTLRSWERRFGFPEPRRSAGGHRQYDLCEIEALRSAFEETHNVEALAAERDGDAISPEYGFAWRWASGWLAAARRVAPAAVRDDAVLLFDASATCDLD